MKKLLTLFLISICAVGWRSKDIVNALTQMGAFHASSRAVSTQDPSLRQISIRDMVANDPSTKIHPMSLEEYAELAKSDPNAYQKFLASHQVEEKRSSIDKLMNLLAHGKYE